MRDLNRFLGALSFHIQLFLNGTTFEVNPIDLIALEAIRLFEPEVYREIPGEKDVLTATPKWAHEKDANSDSKRIEELIDLASENNRPAIKNLLGEMFPPSKLRKGLQVEGSKVESLWFQQLRVCSYQVFDRYFQFATPEGDVSQADIDNLIRNMGDTTELENILSGLAEHDLLDVMLTRLASLEESLPLEQASTFLAALYQVGAGKRRYSFYESSPSDRVSHITYWYLQRLSEEHRLTVVEDAIRRTQGLSLAVRTAQLLTRDFDADSRALPFFKEPTNRERLNRVALEAIQISASPDSRIDPTETLGVVSFWAYFDAPAAKQWLNGYLTSRLAIVNYLKSLVSVSDGTGGVREFIFVDSFKSLISMDELQSRVDLHITGDLTTEEIELVRLFRKGVKKHKEGRDQSPMVWMDDDKEE